MAFRLLLSPLGGLAALMTGSVPAAADSYPSRPAMIKEAGIQPQ